ncbi:MAG: T9SS type A sorting domain-containing protein, partial [Chitinophagales bacterium]|nr:T9SS type A sorting domain-containing protein [Chitinophagales bacterium]
MMDSVAKKIVLILVICVPVCLLAQDPVAIGDWKSYLPYNGVTTVADAGDKVYAGNNTAVFSFNKLDNSYTLLNKATGLSDVDAVNIFYGIDQKTLVVSYLNSNIDFIIDNALFNFPFIKTGNISGNKSVNHAAFYGDTVLLSCAFGIVVFDIVKKESPATYSFSDSSNSSFRVNASAVFENNVYAGTVNGLYKGNFEANLSDLSLWSYISGIDGLPEGEVTQVATFNNNVYALVEDSLLYFYTEGGWALYSYKPGFKIRHMTVANNSLILTRYKGSDVIADTAQIISIDSEGNEMLIEDEERLVSPRQTTKDADGNLWIADPYRGLVKYSNEIFSYYIPNGPGSSSVFDLEYYNNKLWVAPGEINGSWNYLNNPDGFFVLNYGVWNTINVYQYPQLDTVLDFITLTINARNEKAYFGSYGGGVAEYDPATGDLFIYNSTNSSLQNVTADASGSCRVAGLQFDVNANLWVSNFGASNPLSVMEPSGEWRNFDCALPPSAGNQLAQIVIDDLDQKWIQIPRGTGILVYNHGTSVSDETDDKKRVLGIGAGNGNLPVSFVNCLVKDKDGEIWVGTNEGVAIFYNPGEIFSESTAGDASQPLVNLGGYNEYLLNKEIVTCIAVDGANRKWIGTNSGVFLISADGTEQVLFFNENNSPLLSNNILAITIDGVTGEVFFGTSKGIVSYRSTATDGLPEHTNVKVFPNPVRENYTGLIAISGLVQNAQVKITDVSGKLIYQTTALGGQAIWDGKGYAGDRAATGIYLVFSSGDDGKESVVTK